MEFSWAFRRRQESYNSRLGLMEDSGPKGVLDIPFQPDPSRHTKTDYYHIGENHAGTTI